MPQRAVNARRRDFQALVFDAVHFQCKLQLARDFLAVFHGDELLHPRLRTGSRGLPGQVNGDAEQTTGRALDLYQVITQACYGLLDDLLQCHVVLFNS